MPEINWTELQSFPRGTPLSRLAGRPEHLTSTLHKLGPRLYVVTAPPPGVGGESSEPVLEALLWAACDEAARCALTCSERTGAATIALRAEGPLSAGPPAAMLPHGAADFGQIAGLMDQESQQADYIEQMMCYGGDPEGELLSVATLGQRWRRIDYYGPQQSSVADLRCGGGRWYFLGPEVEADAVAFAARQELGG